MHKPDRPVQASFSEYGDALARLQASDSDFADLCDDFDAVVHAYRRCTVGDGASGEAQEFHALRVELEAEILQRLNQPAATDG